MAHAFLTIKVFNIYFTCFKPVFCVLLKVAFIISHFKVKYERNEFAVQVPQIVSTLTKKVYFMP